MQKFQKKIPASFYQTPAGKEPVRMWLRKLSTHDRKTIGLDIATVEYSWPIGKPLCGSLGDGLWEVRSNITNSRIARIIFYAQKSRMVLLHGFIKKTQ